MEVKNHPKQEIQKSKTLKTNLTDEAIVMSIMFKERWQK
jgi:hypothetical protein